MRPQLTDRKSFGRGAPGSRGNAKKQNEGKKEERSPEREFIRARDFRLEKVHGSGALKNFPRNGTEDVQKKEDEYRRENFDHCTGNRCLRRTRKGEKAIFCNRRIQKERVCVLIVA